MINQFPLDVNLCWYIWLHELPVDHTVWLKTNEINGENILDCTGLLVETT